MDRSSRGVVLALAYVVCACGHQGGAPQEGFETGPCIAGECLGGLMCLSDVCVVPDNDSSALDSTTAPPGASTSDDDDDVDDDDSALDDSTGSATCPDGDCGACMTDDHVPCDKGTADPFVAMGLNCPGEPQLQVSTMGSMSARGVRTGFGTTDTWSPREGSAYAVIGTGLVGELDSATPAGDMDGSPTHCNDALPDSADPGAELPAPIRINDVEGDCGSDPDLLGTGDCSNTIEGQFIQGMAAFDYAELRIVAAVPAAKTSLHYDFAFFSAEYPFYYGDVFNDMFIAWLESERWTGNISFDAVGNAVSLNAGFLDYRDDGGNLPELAGTCMRQHAGTAWLRSAAPVVQSETITLVLAVFDLGDPIVDSYVFVDNVAWGCDDLATPGTTPVD